MKLASVEIELEHFPPTLIAEAERAFHGDYREKLIAIVEGILLARRGGYLERHHPDFSLELVPGRSNLRARIIGIPENKLVHGKLVKLKELQIMAGIRDLLFSRTLRQRDHTPEAITDYIFNFVRNAGILSRKDVERNPHGRVMIQGGHHIPRHESVHHKRLGFGMGLLGLEMVTGSGPGSMEDPFKGALRGYVMNHHQDRHFVGITEDGIISGEPCNDYIDSLIVFPDMEKRLEAFVRMSRAGIMLPGGVGTFEEILTILWIKMHPRNKDLRFPIYFCQPEQSGNYFRNILDFLKLCFDIDFLDAGFVNFYMSESLEKTNPEMDPKRAAYDLFDEMKENSEHQKKVHSQNGDPWFPLWDWEVYFPEQLQHPLRIEHSFVESLRFDRRMPMEDLFFSLRSLSSALVETNVRDRGYLDKHGPFKLRGEVSILKAIDALFESFAKEGRMGGREYRCPYQIVT